VEDIRKPPTDTRRRRTTPKPLAHFSSARLSDKINKQIIRRRIRIVGRTKIGKKLWKRNDIQEAGRLPAANGLTRSRDAISLAVGQRCDTRKDVICEQIPFTLGRATAFANCTPFRKYAFEDRFFSSKIRFRSYVILLPDRDTFSTDPATNRFRPFIAKCDGVFMTKIAFGEGEMV